MLYRIKPLALATSLALLQPALAAGAAVEVVDSLPEVLITATSIAPQQVAANPKAPRLQSTQANDGAAFLKSVPGMSLVRKGGSSGDPVFRGLGGSRLGILADDTQLYGGCGGRMDPPTAYIFPESYDRVLINKGPQTVLAGSGMLAGVVRFERKPPAAEDGGSATMSALGGSFGRQDWMADLVVRRQQGYVEANVSHSASGDYRDGDGNDVHSRYQRNNSTLRLGLRPSENDLLELSIDSSRGEAAYADRMMDGSRFDRDGSKLLYRRQQVSSLISELKLQGYYNAADHVMDNFSLRTPKAPAADQPQSSTMRLGNPDRRTTGGKAEAVLNLAQGSELTVGVEQTSDRHRGRGGLDYQSQPRLVDITLNSIGSYAELNHEAAAGRRWVLGLRNDYLRAEDYIEGEVAGDHLPAGFIRHEISQGAVSGYVGLGYASRGADYWERNRQFDLSPEKLTQIDAGAAYQSDKLKASVSAYYGYLRDYLLISWNRQESWGAKGVTARLYGAEADASYRLGAGWQSGISLAWVRGQNDSDGVPLPQIAPLEANLRLTYDSALWLGGVNYRAVAAQHRVDVLHGGIAGYDFGESAGFGVTSAYLGVKPLKDVSLTAGVENLFDVTYTEHLAKKSFDLSQLGYPRSERVNEPGRTLWLKAMAKF